VNDPPTKVVALTVPIVAVVEKRLVVEAVEAKRFVEVALVITDDVAKTFCE
jgi:hypothetical protein